jgi:7-cyano-7-deazaguanine synthase in queuosine biosynthesis
MIELCYLLSALTDTKQLTIEPFLNMNTKELVPIDIHKYRDCEICNTKKHERTSHCRQCDKCVLRRDHHCVWNGNCGGYANNQYFVNFLIWVIVIYI